MRYFVFCCVFLCAFPLNAEELPISAKRLNDESFQEAVSRVQAKVTPALLWGKKTPIRQRVLIKNIDYSKAPMVSSYDELIALYHTIRDPRFLYEPLHPLFPRRISWLYPDDGCYARAALGGIYLANQHMLRPAKIFAFGDLRALSPFAKNGSVSWWYHVALVVNYMGMPYVLDPALNREKPLPAEEWYGMMGDNITGVVCTQYTYHPFDDCFLATESSERSVHEDEEKFLQKEWNRLVALILDPLTLLGEHPPWGS